jgi:hypothetical protein
MGNLTKLTAFAKSNMTAKNLYSKGEKNKITAMMEHRAMRRHCAE